MRKVSFENFSLIYWLFKRYLLISSFVFGDSIKAESITSVRYPVKDIKLQLTVLFNKNSCITFSLSLREWIKNALLCFYFNLKTKKIKLTIFLKLFIVHPLNILSFKLLTSINSFCYSQCLNWRNSYSGSKRKQNRGNCSNNYNHKNQHCAAKRVHGNNISVCQKHIKRRNKRKIELLYNEFQKQAKSQATRTAGN